MLRSPKATCAQGSYICGQEVPKEGRDTKKKLMTGVPGTIKLAVSLHFDAEVEGDTRDSRLGLVDCRNVSA